jgi:hypothetical protein
MRLKHQSNGVLLHPVGAWRVAAGSALALLPKQASTIRVVRGRAWVTRSGDAIDHVLDANAQITALPNQKLVLEGLCGDVWFEWFQQR